MQIYMIFFTMGATSVTFNIYYLQITKIDDLHQMNANILQWIKNAKTRTASG